jgi:Ca-activated chloride channel homolog
MRKILLVASMFLGCGLSSSFSGNASGEFGATPGGIKDLRLARDLVTKKRVPPADAVLVEAMFAEHDLPLTGSPCDTLLCLRAAAGIAPDLEGKALGLVQIGLSSSIDVNTWVRPATTFVMTVDVSGSMGWSNASVDRPSAGLLARKALHGLVDTLRPDDRVAIVTYGSTSQVFLSLRHATDLKALHAAIDSLKEDGSTNMEAGVKEAIGVARSPGDTKLTRLVLFTDVQPNVNATTPTEFEKLIAEAAAQEIHTSVLALGVGIGAELTRGMSAVRGANAFSMTQLADVDSFLKDDAPYFSTPIAFDLNLASKATAPWRINRGFGFPKANDGVASSLQVASVFLSQKRGALLVALEAPTEVDLSHQLALSYKKPDGTVVEKTLEVSWATTSRNARRQSFEQPSVARTTSLALLTEAMHDALVEYSQGKKDEAQTHLERAHERFVADAEELKSPDLQNEVEFSAALLALVKSRANQGTLYGQ